MTDLNVIKELSIVAYEFLLNFKPEDYDDSRYELRDGLYVNIETYETQERKCRKFESHEKYIDIQYMISGEEIITVAPVLELRVCDEYNEERDIIFYDNCLTGGDYLLKTGEFLVFKPGEGHMPCICINGTQQVRKVVIKVPV